MNCFISALYPVPSQGLLNATASNFFAHLLYRIGTHDVLEAVVLAD